ncbi:lysophospholipid acyltransferase family protein [Pedobacter deserti]|uniref:lysophospholipid acyltransferase family protein n=1 Tax=Pedobacter deserti TaxID=2817382 RepID=UPI00210CF907|nr:lysophospholipid acyltransferase family protein [Pedobacter sp. SYSU D00382]
MNKILRHTHRYYTLFVIVALSLLFYPFYYAFSRNERGYGVLNRLRKINSMMISVFTGIFFSFEYEEPLNHRQTYIYCANHTSNLDIMIMCILARGRFHFMGKQELLNNPVLRIFFETIDVPVDRDSKMSSFRAFKRVGDNLDKGMSLIIFPEGKIDDHYPPVLLPFKNGPFRLAIEKNVAIVPVSLIGVWQKMWDDGSRFGSKPGLCRIYVHKPVATKDLNIDDSDTLKDRIFETINSKLLQ